MHAQHGAERVEGWAVQISSRAHARAPPPSRPPPLFVLTPSPIGRRPQPFGLGSAAAILAFLGLVLQLPCLVRFVVADDEGRGGYVDVEAPRGSPSPIRMNPLAN